MTALDYILGGLCAATLGLSLLYLQLGKHRPAILWGLAAWIVFGGGLALRFWQIEGTRDVADTTSEAKRLADTAEKQLETADRPWVTVGMEVVAAFKSTSDGKNVSLGMMTTMKNVGKSVAQNVGLKIAIYPQKDGQTVFTEPMERQQNLCSDTSDESGFLKLNLFPNEQGQLASSLTLSKDEIAAVAATYPKRVPYPALQPIIFGCVTYTFENSKRVHHTYFAYQVSRVNPKDPYHPYLFDSTNLPTNLKRIALIKFPDAKAHAVD